ncbi:hypothetical protein Catovirus_2_241 [Catovirus CTV1]|mgnify:CR=1 FL=1|uniref:EF-hand domain-containing protein n=1 Tax=Catovirus CTV1 TaxID=1977631 RepID=A0A1V0SC61_9VIRU|nr:hypothetical protein Catovirus_2_241 [Catovirus CTV1]
MSFDLQNVKSLFDKIVQGQNIDSSDISKLIFDKNFKLPEGFLTSDDFQQIIDAFNFNSDNKVDIEDFKYLKEHIQDLDVIVKLIKIIVLTIVKFCKIRKIKLSQSDMLDTVIRIIVYCVLYIVAANCEEFRKWASTGNGKSNADSLFEILTDIIDYIRTADEIRNVITFAIKFFKEKAVLLKNCCINLVTKSDDKIKNANVEIKSLKAQLKKEYKSHEIIKKINNIHQ